MKRFTDYLEMIQEAKTNNKNLLEFKNPSEEIKHYEDQLRLSSFNQSAIKKLIELYSKKNTVGNKKRLEELQKLLNFGKKLKNDFEKNYSVDNSIEGLTAKLNEREAQKKLEKNSANQIALASSIKKIKIQIAKLESKIKKLQEYIKEQTSIANSSQNDDEKRWQHEAQADGAEKILNALKSGADENSLKKIYTDLEGEDDSDLQDELNGMEESLELIGIKVE